MTSPPELRLSFLMIYDWDGESAMFYPSLTYNPLSWLEVTLAVQGTAGPAPLRIRRPPHHRFSAGRPLFLGGRFTLNKDGVLAVRLGAERPDGLALFQLDRFRTVRSELDNIGFAQAIGCQVRTRLVRRQG